MRQAGDWGGILLSVCLFLMPLLAAAQSAGQAQGASRPADSPMMRQLHQALSLADHGDKQQAMTLALQLLQQNPKFVPALKLKGMLLEESGQNSEAAAAYQEGLKLAPSDPDLLLKTGIYKLAAGDREEALKLLQHCARLLPGDGDAHYYLAQAYHLNGHDDLALAAIKQSLKADPDNPPVWQKYGEAALRHRQLRRRPPLATEGATRGCEPATNRLRPRRH